MCKRDCLYRQCLINGAPEEGGERMCNYCGITGRTRTAELAEAYREKGRKLTDRERKRILTDEAHCPWYRPREDEVRKPVAPQFFNSRQTMTGRRCEACGKTYVGGRRSMYCPECRDARKREIQAKWWSEEVVNVCLDCGRSYTGTRHQSYCPECRREHRAAGGRNSAGHRGRGPAKEEAI